MPMPKKIAAAIAQALDSKQGEDIQVLEVTELTTLADYFILCTATSTTRIKTLTEETEQAVKALGEPPGRIEGYRGGSWVLIDYGSVVAHLFLQETRAFYDLERLWGDARQIPLSELGVDRPGG